MANRLLLLVIGLLYITQAWAQVDHSASVKGLVSSKDDLQPLVNATVSLLYQKDSLKAAQTFTNDQGTFLFHGIKKGKYHIAVTYLGYQPVLHPIEVPATDTLISIGTILLPRSGVTLKMVEIVKARAPVLIKKDTMEFNAEFFKTRRNALMEELLKKLPGLQIEKDGTITVNGEKVSRLLVDGRRYFSDDPKLAIKNLSADIIDKVQVIDKSTDPSTFTEKGSAEGKTINITIRREKKDQFIGRAAAGYGTDNRFALNGNLNRFSDGEQLALLGSMNNVNNASFLDGEISSILGNGWGIITNRNGGLNYNKDLNEKLKLSSSYVITTERTDNSSDTYRENVLPDTTYYYNQHANSENSHTVHAANASVEYRPDSMHTLHVSSNFSRFKINNIQQNQYESLNGERAMVNTGYLDNTGNLTILNLSGGVAFSKQFRKKGRIFNTSLEVRHSKVDEDNFNRSNSTFKQPDGVLISDTINQYNNIANSNNFLNYRLFYAEPLFRDGFLDLNFAYTRDYTSKEKLTYDYNKVKGEYDRFNDSLSNSFQNTSKYYQASISIRSKKERYGYNIGLNMLLSSLDNYDFSTKSSLRNSVTNFFPTATFNYDFPAGGRLNFTYAGNPEQPNVNHLQPVPDNKDPLYIQLGNPDLKPGFTHNIVMAYSKLNPKNLRNFAINVNSSLATNKIINANWFDSLGRQVSQPQNMNGAYSINLGFLNTLPLKQGQSFINANTGFGLRRDISYVNGVKGGTMNFSISQGLGSNYTFGELLELSALVNANYNGVRYALTKQNNTNYFSYNVSCNARVALPLGFGAGVNLDYLLNAGRAEGYNQRAALLTAHISKELFRRKQGLLKLQGFDILKQNMNITRTVSENYIEDVQTRVLTRFFMLSFTWFLKPAENAN